jgi:hypothetical protein
MLAQSVPEVPSEAPRPATHPDEPAVVDPQSRDQILMDYFKNKLKADKHPTQVEAEGVIKAAGKTWDRESIRKKFNEIARTRGVEVGKGIRGNRRANRGGD